MLIIFVFEMGHSVEFGYVVVANWIGVKRRLLIVYTML